MPAVVLTFLVGCGSDSGASGVSARLSAGLTVSGYACPTSGNIAGRTIPADGMYYLTTFGGGSDTQAMACGGEADGTWLYTADSWRYGCGAHVRITNPATGRWCVAQVADIGPNICVEEAASRPIVDASPVVGNELFGMTALGWSDRMSILVARVDSSVALGCGDATSVPLPMDAGTVAPPPAPDASVVDTITPDVPAIDAATLDAGVDVAVPPPDDAGAGFDAMDEDGDAGADADANYPYDPGAGCYSDTLGASVEGGACVQSASDGGWYQCTSIGWVRDDAIASSHVGGAGPCTVYDPQH